MNAPRSPAFCLRAAAPGVGLGLALCASNGPAVGLPIGVALALVFGLIRRRPPGC